MISPVDHLLTFIGGFGGIALIGFLNDLQGFQLADKFYLIGSFGASAVLIYGLVNSPLTQPRNLFGGHLLSAFIGVSIWKIFGEVFPVWFAPALAVSTSIVLMQITKTLHPPGGATALIATIGSEKIKALGYWYLLSPVLCGVLALFFVALLVNNLHKARAYPKKWF